MTKHFLQKYKWAIILLAIAAFLFYWYEVRPIAVARSCAASASADARKLLKSKAEIAKNSEQGKAYQGLVDKNMYLRSDYESFLQKCLLNQGIITKDMFKNVASSAMSSSAGR